MKDKKTIILIAFVIGIIMFSMPKIKKEENKEIIDKENIIAIKLKDGSNYTDTDTVPSSGYTLNTTESICKDSSGNKIDTSFEYSNGKVKIPVTKKGTKCSLVFDKANLKDMILTANGGESAIKAKGNPDFSKTSCTSGTYNGTSRTCGEDTTGMWAMEDDYGTSYYFRGSPTNNYVKFGKYSKDIYYGYYSNTSSSYKEYFSLSECQNASSYNRKCSIGIAKDTNMYWRIIRINGDGTIRMIYDGTSYHSNGTSTSNSIAVSLQVFNSSRDNNAYLGYTYKSPYNYIDGGQSSGTSSIYASPRDMYTYGTSYTFDGTTGNYTLTGTSNEYANSNVVGKYTCGAYSTTTCTTLYKIASYDSNSAQCYAYSLTAISNNGTPVSSNAKTQLDTWYTSSGLSSYSSYLVDSGFCGDRTSTTTSGGIPNNTGGTGTTTTYYGARYRLLTKKEPTLKCSTISYGSGYESGSKSDVYTVSSTKGNGQLQYPIGLISADEVAVAGGTSNDIENIAYYLYNGNTSWTMSPASFMNTSYAFVWRIDSNGSMYNGERYGDAVNGAYGLRPVINLDPTKINSITMDSNGVYVVS